MSVESERDRAVGARDGERGNASDDVNEDLSHQEDDEEEGRLPRRMPNVCKPSKDEIDEHEKTHCPFRAWCRSCVLGRATNAQHRSITRGLDCDREVPRVSMDYFFMSKDDEAASRNPVFVMVDEQTSEQYSRAVGQKGLGSNGEIYWLVKDIVEELRVWGRIVGLGWPRAWLVPGLYVSVGPPL